MSKRKALWAPVGVLGALIKEARLLERAGFIVDVDEANAKSWHIALEPKLLKQHGLGTSRVCVSTVTRSDGWVGQGTWCSEGALSLPTSQGVHLAALRAPVCPDTLSRSKSKALQISQPPPQGLRMYDTCVNREA